ncbi:hypothetical protein N7462_005652 [Penicillium macrosclerotiorum]|uniref:uncharacterized protein n=1 Tax=Penicillium macrosclerotiorum TaxID=303699 RepID=UPI0025480A51|nr:uncharacterized protein N7462_005652 [Penicillium macrosclerotiorum]KAJ5682487.1 hypothetical protein N7462_005652 [Penicillium macrosclerotiorum]
MGWLGRVLRYLRLKILVTLLRTAFRLSRPLPIATNPHTVLGIPSRDAKRKITAHVYARESASLPSQPVLINFHGSGMIFPHFGSDDEFCHYISQNTEVTVLDVQYRLSPENPFPAALNDVEDVIRWVLGQPDKYDLTRLSISGFSAGGNLALAASGVLLPQDTFRSVLAFYPGTDLFKNPEGKAAFEDCGKTLPPRISRLFSACYIPEGVDARDPRISPIYADPARFPARMLMITASGDNMAPEAEELAALVEKQANHHVVLKRMEHCIHGFDKNTKPGTVAEEAKIRAYSMAAEMLKE